MAKVKNPLASISARGAVGKLIIFTADAVRQSARGWHKPTGTPSASQQTRRAKYTACAAAWNALTSEQKAAYDAEANLKKITSYNAYMGGCLLTTQPTCLTSWDAGETTWDAGATNWDCNL